jgi:hypothetical protein
MVGLSAKHLHAEDRLVVLGIEPQLRRLRQRPLNAIEVHAHIDRIDLHRSRLRLFHRWC